MKYNIFVISRGRWDCCLTARALDIMGVNYFLVVYPDEKEKYEQAKFKNAKIIVFEQEKYERAYVTHDDFSDSIPVGSGPIRNFVWDYSISIGDEWHFILDDNIEYFSRNTGNANIIASDNRFFNEMFDFIRIAKLDNVGLFGCQYEMFAPDIVKKNAFVFNTRIFSAIGIRNSLPLRWSGRFNEDVILSVEVLKRGYGTLLFQTHLAEKKRTQTLKGGNTSNLYNKTGTFMKSDILVKLYPELAKHTVKFNRAHHEIDLSPFKTIPLSTEINYDIEGLTNVFSETIFKYKSEAPAQIIITFKNVEEREKFLDTYNLRGIARAYSSGVKKVPALSCWWDDGEFLVSHEGKKRWKELKK